MSREKAAYRQNLEDILDFTGGRRMLSVGDVRRYLGFSDNRCVKKRFPIVNGYISAVTLASCLAEGSR